MGDRALIVFHDDAEVSPTVYIHWNGQDIPEWLATAGPTLRKDDVSYACARFIGFCHGKINGNLSLGTFNTPDDLLTYDDAKMRGYHHGDAGLFLVNVKTGEVRNWRYEGPAKVSQITMGPK